MTDENVETMKADAKKAVSDLGNIMSHVKADAKADVEKVKAKFGHDNGLISPCAEGISASVNDFGIWHWHSVPVPGERTA